MTRATRIAAEALVLGAIGWLLFLAVASWAAAGAEPADPRAGYPPEWGFVAQVATRSVLLCAALAVVAWLLVRRDEPAGRGMCAAAAGLLVAAWAVRSGLAAGDLGRAADPIALAAATGPHTAAELGLIVSPLLAGARGVRPSPAWLIAAGAGLVACAVLEAFL